MSPGHGLLCPRDELMPFAAVPGGVEDPRGVRIAKGECKPWGASSHSLRRGDMASGRGCPAQMQRQEEVFPLPSPSWGAWMWQPGLDHGPGQGFPRRGDQVPPGHPLLGKLVLPPLSLSEIKIPTSLRLPPCHPKTCKRNELNKHEVWPPRGGQIIEH